MPDEYRVPEIPEGLEGIEFNGMRVVADANVPLGMVEEHDEGGRLLGRFDWRSDFEQWKREQNA